MAYSNVNLKEGTRIMYLYKTKIHNTEGTGIVIEEYPVEMDKWKETKDKPKHMEIEYYRALPNQPVTVPPIAVTEIGTLYHGTYMLLDKPDKNYYVKKLVKFYKDKIDEYNKGVNRFEKYIEHLSNLIPNP